ncbi:MAG TPA: topoisomerase C-terminal repeat-containing protein, partial [Longimicrobium sp.]|nr:topoisomerase C-terminal repeat-containing protein [Longimicrobium sp.]
SRIKALYGDPYLSPSPRQFTTTSKGAQEAHEAIRPAGTEMRTTEETGLTGQEAALYDLIWKRTVASQMADARQTHLTALIHADDAVFRASGKRIDFPGFFRAYVEGSDDPDAAMEDREEPLPALRRGDAVSLRDLEALSHQTQPPARYTEASLVKKLEAEGIGRPSTYASIIETIADRRGYVARTGTQLVPTFTAFAVTGLLEKNFPHLVDTRFTARMEEELDEIAGGEAEWLPYLRDFYRGPEGLEEAVARGEKQIDPREASTVRLDDLPAQVRIGRFGPFVVVGEGETAQTASIPDGMAPADLTSEQVERLVAGPRVLGVDPETGRQVLMRTGRKGAYVQLAADEGEKPRSASLLRGMEPSEMTLETALRLLSLPRSLGTDPASGKEVQAGIGLYGPYVKLGKEFRSLKPGDDVFTVSLERALELLAAPKRGPEPLRTLGTHPADGAEVTVWKGRFGPYVKHGDVNATVRDRDRVDALTLDDALALLADKVAQSAPARST